MSKLNIGGSEDAFFRYKMPDIEVKIEGRGNGIKTVIPNMEDIAQALHRDPGYPTKFFATELGALSQWDEKRKVGIVNGEHSKDTLSKLLAQFIDRYVLCPQCKLPETDIKIKKKQIYYKCKACGFYDLGDNQHKLATYIINHPPPSSKKDGKGKPDKKERRREKANKSKQDQEEEEGEEKNAQETNETEANNKEAEPKEANGKESKKSKAPKEEEIHFEVSAEDFAHIKDEDVTIDDPIQKVLDCIEAGSTIEEKVANVKKHQKEEGFDDSERMRYVFKALVTDSMAKQVVANVDLIAKFVEEGTNGQMAVLALVEERCETHTCNYKYVSKALSVLYDNDVLEEDAILHWHNNGVSPIYALADVAAAKKTHKSASAFVEWLKTADEEDDE